MFLSRVRTPVQPMTGASSSTLLLEAQSYSCHYNA